MPSIFRRMRKFFFFNNDTTRYLKYALGEIVLVVIGILIALEVNNYNEHRKALKKEKAYLEKIAQNIDNSSRELQRVIKETEDKQQRIDSLNTILKAGDFDKYSTDDIIKLIFPLIGYTIYTSDHSATVELLSTGDLQLIRNSFVRNQVSSRQSDLHEIEKYEQENLYYVRKYGDYLNQNIDSYILFNDANKTWPVKGISKGEFLTSTEYLNNFISVDVSNRSLQNKYEQEKQKLDSISVVISELLESYNEAK